VDSRWLLLAMLACAGACAGRRVLPTVPRPAIVERHDPRPELPASRLVLPLESDIGAYEPMLAEVLRDHLKLAQRSWLRVTPPGVEPTLEVRYEAQLGAPLLRVEGKTVRVEVPLTYWGEVRARPNAHAGAMWLSKGTPWGDALNPGHITLAISVKPEVDEQWRLRTTTKLLKVTLAAPPFEQVCTDTIIRACVSRDQAVKHVHGLLERELRGRSPALLAALDTQVEERADLRAAIEMGFRALSMPAGPEQLWLAIERMGLGPLHGSEHLARLDLELVFRPWWGGDAPGKRTGLPPRKALGKKPSALVFDVELPFAELSQQLSQSLRGLAGESWRLVKVEALGATATGSKLVLALHILTGERWHVVYAACTPAPLGDMLGLGDVKLSSASQALAEALDIDEDELTVAIGKYGRVPLRQLAQRHVTDVQKRLALLTLAFGAVALQLEATRYESVWFSERGLDVRVTTEIRAEVLH
jgi:hypothetical protein